MSEMLPQIFLDRLRLMFPDEDDYVKIVSSFSIRKPPAIRMNTLKTNKNSIRAEFQKNNIQFKMIPWYENAFLIINKSIAELVDMSMYKNGEIYIQSLSSMVPPLVLDPIQDGKILDMAAAPGSKTSQIAMMIQNKGELVANDSSRERLYKLKANMQVQGVTNVKVTGFQGESVWRRYPEYFDSVLVDAPCSMEGRFEAGDKKTYDHWSLKKVKNLSKLQRWLLRSAVSATKPGGIIVYSTCTLSPEENEDVIDWILEKEAGKIELMAPPHSSIPFVPGLSSWEGKAYSQEMYKTKRILPDDVMEGFYVAKIKKISSTISSMKHTVAS